MPGVSRVTVHQLGLVLAVLIALCGCGTAPSATSADACRKSLAEDPTPPAQRLFNINNQTVGVSRMQLVTDREGWIIAGGHLYWTSDRGCHWRNITPEDGPQWEADAVFFLDPLHGWVAWPTAVFRTTDGGHSWQKNRIKYSADFAGLQFIDANNGWLAISVFGRGEMISAVPGDEIFRTTDGGVHWTDQSDSRLNGGQMRFVSVTVGWAISYGQKTLYGTQDSGQTWKEVAVPLPAGYDDLQLALPTFSTSSNGVFQATLMRHRSPVGFTYYVTNDGGRTWSSTRLFSGPPLPIPDAVGGTVWLVAHPSATTTDTIETTSDAGGTWTTIRPVGLPPIDELDFATPLVGWARPRAYECVGVGKACSYREDLMLTVDGGKHWTTIDLKAAGL